MLRYVNAICFSRKNVVYLYSEEERVRKQGLSPLFWAQNEGRFPFERKISLVASGKFLVASGKFLLTVGARSGFSRNLSALLIIKKLKVFSAKKSEFLVAAQVVPECKSMYRALL